MKSPRFCSRFLHPWFLFPLAILIQGCGDDGPTKPADEPPEVTSITPSGGTVGLLQEFALTFSEPMNPATLNASTVTATPMAGSLYLNYDEDARTLWVAPDSLFPPSSNLTLSVSSGATDMAGNGLVPYSGTFTTGAMECANLGDRFEPNDAVEGATEMGLDELVVGLSSCGEDRDFFRFTLTETAKVTARTPITYGDTASWGIYWRRENGDTYSTRGTSARTGEENAFHYTFLPGTYWVETFVFDEEDLVLYDLILETGAPCADDAYEDNDFLNQAVEVTPGTLDLVGCYVDADWFSVPIATGQTISVTMDPGAYTGTKRLHVREPGGSGQTETNRDPTVTLSVTATQDGLAFFYAQAWDDDTPYELIIEVINP